ncbi:hypothetical protein IFM89_019361 [Coptis chinensis]|uniref:Protein FAR1-RELATED SEQUENCE n=1 Tax=Coptis chinensis TaxID=261450 RepID=A0A835MD11_9MAGN|nr:hypothetical protein IFM89_019361 [Coptis chinensis]
MVSGYSSILSQCDYLLQVFLDGYILQKIPVTAFDANGMVESSEPVPFRLTRNMQTFFSHFRVEGLIVSAMCAAGQALVPTKQCEHMWYHLAMFFCDELLYWSWRRPSGLSTFPNGVGCNMNPSDFKHKITNNVECSISRIKGMAPQCYLKEAKRMDVVWGETAGVEGQLWFFCPILFILQGFEAYIGLLQLKTTLVGVVSEWQVVVCGILLVVMVVGNFANTVQTLMSKSRVKAKMKTKSCFSTELEKMIVPFFMYEDSDFVDVSSMGEGENVEIHENSDRDSDGCEASRVFEADKATFYSMRFKTIEEAFAIYNQYAKLVGFSIRKEFYWGTHTSTCTRSELHVLKTI